ncbi:MAG: MFS transporter [Planctomycetaceae bacterium]
MAARLSWRLRWKLSVLWALQWGITGAVLTYLPLYLDEKGVHEEGRGQLMAVSAIGLWLAPLVVGQICDRWLATEKYLAFSHFIGGLTLISIPIATEIYQKTGENFSVLLTLFGLYAVAYIPTIPLASSLTFRHLPDPDAQFGSVRVWGTVGWMLAGLSLSLWLGRTEAHRWLLSNYPQLRGLMAEITYTFAWLSPPSSSDCFRIAALLSFALSTFCGFLPSTPPVRNERASIAPLQVLRMFRNRQFTLLISVTFLLAMVVPFYTLEVPKLLAQSGFDDKWIPAVMTIGQVSEFPALLFLPLFLRWFGLKATFALGMAAWLLRYSFFAMEQPRSLVLAGVALHGVCHVFLIVVIQLYIDSKCRRDLRASAQNLFAFLTMGIAMPAGFLFGGKLAEWCIDRSTGVTDYRSFFAVPAAFVLALLIFYWKAIGPDEPRKSETLPVDPEAAHNPASPTTTLAGSE